MRRLEGKVALISGGASGIGLAAARRFAEEGAIVVLADLNREAAERAAGAIAGASVEPLDVTLDDDWRRAADAVAARHGGLDVLVNSAGIVAFGSVEDVSLEDWRRTMAVNLDGTFLGCRHGVRVMKAGGRGGSIVNLSSVSGIIGGHNIAAYNAAKGGVRLLTKSVALHCARKGYGIRCNSVHPGFVETPMLDEVIGQGRDPDETRMRLRASVPLGRNARAEEVAAMIAYLASDEAAFVTGAELVIDGGVTAM
ncbi:MAG TPA: glucose 1-dehydrogenase [Beijerinckiaceae bacterium]|jgi:NAD(P)-dependent dehydrogenase (short-subunit alcohol dehydrogenase family)